MRFASCLALLVAAPLAAGCINTDTAVFVEPSITNPSATVTPMALGATLKGTFTLSMHLGARASDTSLVSVGEFEIQDANRTKTLVSPLVVDVAIPTPLPLEPGADALYNVEFDTGAKPLGIQMGMDLCAAGMVVITGVIQDSLQDTATPMASPAFAVEGCM